MKITGYVLWLIAMLVSVSVAQICFLIGISLGAFIFVVLSPDFPMGLKCVIQFSNVSSFLPIGGPP